MSDRFRKQARPLQASQVAAIERLKDLAEEFESVLTKVPFRTIGREGSLALTNLEQAVMWAVKDISR